MQLHVEILGIPQALIVLEHLEHTQQAEVVTAVSTATVKAQTVARRLSPVKTGRLRAGNKVRQSMGGTRYLIINDLYNDVPYAVYVCYGTRKMRARDFMTPALVEARKWLVRELSKAFGGS